MESTELKLPLSRLRVSADNPRGQLQPQDWAGLVPSVSLHGVIQPILVRPIDGEDAYEIVAGERRYRAANEAFAGNYDIPVLMRKLTDAEAYVLASIENMQRERMNPAREAEACQKVLSNLNGDKCETARQLGWSVETLERRLALMACTQGVRDALVAKQIQLGHAELLAAIPPATQDSTLKKIIEHGVSVGTLKEQLGQFARKLVDAPFDKTECASCPHNSNRQSQLFSESLGDGYCTHPTHYDELVTRQVDTVAARYKDTYPVVRIVKPKDGFVPLPVQADGELGVGDEQYEACKGCASFGCSISAMPGTYGNVQESLCFDAACNSKKIAARRKSEREASAAANTDGPGKTAEKAGATAKAAPTKAAEATTNGPSTRVLDHRYEQWRKWIANELMQQSERNQRVLIAVLLSSNQSRLGSAEFGSAVKTVTGIEVGHNMFEGALRDAERVEPGFLPRLIECVTASAAFGLDRGHIESLMNYLEIDEAKHFKLDASFLDLFTKSELDSLAGELKLKKAMGEGFGKARDGKKEAFIKALLSVPGFQYEGLVPKVMRYKRKAFPYANRESDATAPESVKGMADAAT